METIEEIEMSLKAPCLRCAGTGRRHRVWPPNNEQWCVACFGSGLQYYANIPDEPEELSDQYFEIAKRNNALGLSLPWTL